MMMCCMLGLALGVHAQESVFLQQYREKVKAYNQDIKSAGYAVSIRQEAEKSAKADFLPSLSGNANAVRPKQGGVTSGKGLENLSQRYRLLCGKEIVIEQNEKEFIVKLPLLYDQD